MKKKSIITKGLIATGMLYANVNASVASQEDVIKDNIETALKHTNMDVENGVNQIYHWRIETEAGVFSGACKSIDEVNKEIEKHAGASKVFTKSITPITLSENETGDTLFTWSVITKKGHASGQSATLEEAQHMIKLFHSEDVVKSNIIKSKK
ncbi:hypothetical protein ACFFU9_11730 [Mariniflexile ostreae]|uniref:Uncharacterized protein n=1 Tax=Mariniflexile ostreae TaxID=1520892 RepID=A0ABV5FD92_9FLAO